MEETECREGTEAWGQRCAPDFNKTSWVSPQLSPQESWKGHECKSLFTQTRLEKRQKRCDEKREEKRRRFLAP